MQAPYVNSVDWQGLGFDRTDVSSGDILLELMIFSEEDEGCAAADGALITRCQPDLNDLWRGSEVGVFSQIIGRLCDSNPSPETQQLLVFGGPLMCLDTKLGRTIKERDLGWERYAVISPSSVKMLIEVGEALPLDELQHQFEAFVATRSAEFSEKLSGDQFRRYCNDWINILKWAAIRQHGIVSMLC